MATILDKYGIKEVADVVFYELDSKGAPSAPVLYLDSLKVSTIEQSAEVVDAQGGKGNVKLISWDTNKEVKATFEDALFSVKSLAIMFGGKVANNENAQEVLKTVSASNLVSSTNGWKIEIGKNTVYLATSKGTYFFYDKDTVKPVNTTTLDAVKAAFNGSWDTVAAAIAAKAFDFVTFDLLDCTTADVATGGTSAMKSGLEIKIDASTFGGTYYITGDTYARNYQSGKDEFLQFVIPKGKVSSEDLSLTMEADGDPATFSMDVNVLKASDGTMFKLVKYSLDDATSGDTAAYNKGVASVAGQYNNAGIENAGFYSSNSSDPGYSVVFGDASVVAQSDPQTPNRSGHSNKAGE